MTIVAPMAVVRRFCAAIAGAAPTVEGVHGVGRRLAAGFDPSGLGARRSIFNAPHPKRHRECKVTLRGVAPVAIGAPLFSFFAATAVAQPTLFGHVVSTYST